MRALGAAGPHALRLAGDHVCYLEPAVSFSPSWRRGSWEKGLGWEGGRTPAAPTSAHGSMCMGRVRPRALVGGGGPGPREARPSSNKAPEPRCGECGHPAQGIPGRRLTVTPAPAGQ